MVSTDKREFNQIYLKRIIPVPYSISILKYSFYRFYFQKNKELMTDIITNCKLKNGEYKKSLLNPM